MFVLAGQVALPLGGNAAVPLRDLYVTGQSEAKPESKAEPGIMHPLPFSQGEVLTYDIGFSKFFLSGTVGELKLSVGTAPAGSNAPTKSAEQPLLQLVDDPEPGPASRGLDGQQKDADYRPGNSDGQTAHPDPIRFEAETVSKGFVTWLFDLRVDDKYESIVDPQDLGLIRSTKTVEEGNKHRQQETVVDRSSGVITYSDRDLNAAAPPANVKKTNSPVWIQDLLSAVYFLRTRELKENTRLTVPVTDKGEIHNIDVVVGKREQVEVGAGKFAALPVEVMVFDGKYIKRTGQLLIWFTDDGRHLPVKARIKSAGATATIKLTHIQSSGVSAAGDGPKGGN